jgi:hypothetical protein
MEDASPRYDFFIAHAGPDRDSAERLFDLLKERSTPFLDSRVLRFPAARGRAHIGPCTVSSLGGSLFLGSCS